MSVPDLGAFARIPTPLRDNLGMQPVVPPDNDPMPQPPEAPDINACCGSGCDPCIFDAHDMAMDEYRQALRAWRERQATRQGDANASSSLNG